MKVRETEIPGVGIRYTLSFTAGTAFVVLIENDGTRQAYWRAGSETDSEKLFEVDESDARKIAEILDGTYFEPIGDDLDDVFEDARIKWVELSADSPLVGQTIGEAGIRTTWGVSVIAIERGESTLTNPTKDTQLLPADVLVTVGTDEQLAEFSTFLS